MHAVLDETRLVPAQDLVRRDDRETDLLHEFIVAINVSLLPLFVIVDEQRLASDLLRVHLQLSEDLLQQEVVVESLRFVFVLNGLKKVV